MTFDLTFAARYCRHCQIELMACRKNEYAGIKQTCAQFTI